MIVARGRNTYRPGNCRPIPARGQVAVHGRSRCTSRGHKPRFPKAGKPLIRRVNWIVFRLAYKLLNDLYDF